MKNKAFLFILLAVSFTSYSQLQGDLLIGITIATTAEMNTVSNPIEGSLIYNSEKRRVYQFNGSTWEELLIRETPKIEAKTSNYTLTSADNGSVFTFNSTVDVIISAGVELPVGFNVSIYQIGEGKVTISGAPGVTIKNRLSRFKTAGKDAGVGLICTATNTFHLTGDLKK